MRDSWLVRVLSRSKWCVKTASRLSERLCDQKALFDAETDDQILVGGSTAAMTKDEFTEYLQKISAYFMDKFNHYIPTPEDYYEN